MYCRKIASMTTALLLGCAALGMGACDIKVNKKDTVKVDKEQLESLNRMKESYAAATQEQRETLYKLMTELNEVADEAFALGHERQMNGQVKNMNMVDRVKYKLATIQTELNQARDKMANNPSLQKEIDDLQRKITAQEDYIDHLRSTIKKKKSDLQKDYEKLVDLRAQKEQNKEKLMKDSILLTKEQGRREETIKKAWEDAGDALVASNDKAEIVKNSGPLQKKTRIAKRRILERAIVCYEKAKENGSATADYKISEAKARIQSLNLND